MPEQQKVTTERLIDVIKVIQFSTQSGVLTVERGGSARLEQGTIFFLNGKCATAISGLAQGEEAFKSLQGWKLCRYHFVHKSNSEVKGLIQALEQKDTGPQQRLPYQTGPQQRLPFQTGPQQRLPFQTGPQEPLRPTTGELPAISTYFYNSPSSMHTPLPPSNSAPQRVRSSDTGVMLKLEKFNQSRVMRHLYLLIDGQRQPSELARITGRNIEEIYMYLLELEQAGLIRQ